MKNYSKLILCCTLFVLGGLVFWQVDSFQKNQLIVEEIEMQRLRNQLLNCAITLRKAQNKDNSLRTDIPFKHALLDSITKAEFNRLERKFSWDYLDGNGNYKENLSRKIDTSQFNYQSLKVCTSCLIMIDMVDETGKSTVDKGYILNQSPSQMIGIKGMDKSELTYLHLYIMPQAFDVSTSILPLLFLVGLVLLFVVLLYLTNKQHHLILQKNEFVNHLSHQFQTPLSSIKLSANLLAHKEKKDQNELIRIIQTESNRLENHIKTVLHWVKSDADRLQLSKKEIRITDLIENSLRQLKPVFISHKTEIKFIPPDTECIVLADPNHLQLMLFNIWENAIKHNKDAVEITISCKKEDDFVLISNVDNGTGLPTNTENIKYKGLGLAYIDKMMKLHDGKMELNSILNKGLTVILNFKTNG